MVFLGRNNYNTNPRSASCFTADPPELSRLQLTKRVLMVPSAVCSQFEKVKVVTQIQFCDQWYLLAGPFFSPTPRLPITLPRHLHLSFDSGGCCLRRTSQNWKATVVFPLFRYKCTLRRKIDTVAFPSKDRWYKRKVTYRVSSSIITDHTSPHAAKPFLVVTHIYNHVTFLLMSSAQAPVR